MLNPTSQQDGLKRLARIQGQVKGIQRMVQEDRYCLDIIIPISAVRKALDQVGLVVMRRHVDSCVSEAIRSKHGSAKVSELMHTMHQFIK